MEVDRNGLEVLSDQECLRLMGTQALGRIGVTVDVPPVGLPVRQQLFDGQIVIQTERDTRLACATTSGAVIAFEVDEINEGGLGWSVAFTGIASEISDPDLLSRLRAMPLTRWVRDADDRYVQSPSNRFPDDVSPLSATRSRPVDWTVRPIARFRTAVRR